MGRPSDKGRLGGAWLPAAIGMSEYKSPLDAWQRVTGQVVDELEGEAIDRGNFLEPALRSWHGKKSGMTVVTAETNFRKDLPWASYSPDGLMVPEGVISPTLGFDADIQLAEYKAPGPEVALKYGEEGSADVPPDVFFQVQWGLFVMNLQKAQVAALIDGQLKIYHLVRDVELEAGMVESATRFMRDYVEANVPPPLTFSDNDTAWVKNRYPRSLGVQQPWSALTREQQRLVETYLEEYRLAKMHDNNARALENAIKEGILKEAESIGGDAGTAFSRVSWKSNSVGTPSWKKVAEELWKKSGMSGEAFDEIVKQFTGEPPRVFRPFMKSEKKVAK